MRKLLTIVVLALGTVLLAGCLPQDPVVTPPPEPSSTPVFASEEEALAAAEKAYAEYLAVSDAILNDGGQDPDRIDAVTVGEVRSSEKDGFAAFRDSGYRSIGSTIFDSMSIQSYQDSVSETHDIVRVYVCSDVSAVEVVDAAGESVVSPDRPLRTAFEVGFDRAESGSIVLSSKDVWDGVDVCV